MQNKISNMAGINLMKADKLSEYIVATHHTYLKKTLDSLSSYFKTITKTDSEKHLEVVEINVLFVELKTLLEFHMSQGEDVFFPYIKKLEEISKNGQNKVDSLKDLPETPLKRILSENKKMKILVGKIRKISKDYSPSINSSPALKLCYAQLFNFEQDVHKLVFLEENVLFPKLAELEKKVQRM